MSTIIKSGTIVTAEGAYQADVLIEGEKIALIGEKLDCQADTVVDATGKYVMPGAIDNHSHFGMPFQGTKTQDCTTTHAAVVGGTTTIIDFVPQPKGMGLIDSYKLHRETKFDGICTPDFAFHAMVQDRTDKMFEEIPLLPDYGISTIKLFMAYKGSENYCDDTTVLRAMQEAKKAGVTLMVHAESADITDLLTKQLVAAGCLEPKYHAVSRPPVVETECIQRVICLARVAESPIFIVHVAAAEAMETLRNAANNGFPIYGETCPQYVSLSVDNLAKPGFEGAKYVCSPALREESNHDKILEALDKGWLQVFASDHSAFRYKGQKDLGLGNFSKIPNGAPGVQHRLHVLWSKGVATGKVKMNRFVDVCSTAPAKFNGLYPQKGTIAVGSDADIIVFDPDYRGTITLEKTYEGLDFTPYEGMEQIGRCDKVFIRGRLMAEKGEFVGQKGEGKFIETKPFGAAYTGL